MGAASSNALSQWCSVHGGASYSGLTTFIDAKSRYFASPSLSYVAGFNQRRTLKSSIYEDFAKKYA